MGTEISTRREIPAPTPQHAKSLSPQQLGEHRAKIASEVKIVLSAYFKPSEDAAIVAGQIAWWCDELEDWTLEQIVWALRQWNRDNPRLRPTPGDIVAVCKKARGRKVAAQLPKQEPEPERKPVDKETAAAIMAAAGFIPKRMTGDA
jgi:hypothetical protein